jgi:hypothetical protein
VRTIERKKGKGLFITDQTPACPDFTPKARKLYRELLEFVKENPKYKFI